jgi:hypothetical protein
MIRPFTLICMVLAGGSGLYLYQCKHQAQVLDREIAKTIKQTETTRERIGMLRAEWALLNEPERLADLARAHMTLQTLQPAQFVAMNDLAAKLPAPPSSQHAPTEAEPEEAPLTAAVTAPTAKPTQVATAASAAAGPETKPPEPKPVVAAAEPKPAPARHPPRPAPVQLAAESAPAHPLQRPRPAASVLPVGLSSEATAPGTVGAAVLRAMRANGYPAAAAPSAIAPAYVRPASAPAPSYAPVASYAAPAGSVLGRSSGSLPPPVPFAAR